MLRSAFSLRQKASGLRTTRLYHATTAARLPYKDSQDRESLKPQSSQHTKSGRDDDAAATEAAFSPNVTSPEKAREKAKRQDGSHALEGSGANQELSNPQGDEKSNHGLGPGKETRKGGTSGRGKSPKKGDPNRLY